MDRFLREVPITPFDAGALALDLTLVTNNPRDFADDAALRIENWVG